MKNIVILIFVGIMFGFLVQYSKHDDHEIMGSKFWRCYLGNVKGKIISGEERRNVVEVCYAEK